MAVDVDKLPKTTPDGFVFPYSHFGDIAHRTELLRKIARTIDISPQVVLNMGCGYDITPSLAFPEARVVHVDMAMPDYAQSSYNPAGFLKSLGFEAYTNVELPEDIEADLGVNILGPGIEPKLLSRGGVLFDTNLVVQDGMEAIAFVDDSVWANVVTEEDKVKDWLDSPEPVHMLITRKT